MALEPASKPADGARPRGPAYALRPFRAEWAGLVAGWPLDATEVMWLAPRTPPPLTPDKVLGWHDASRTPLVLMARDAAAPVAYGELNVLKNRTREFWLGHLIVEPAQRGQGLGLRLTELLLARAFQWHAARRVSLVVFPENRRAIAAYRHAGFRIDGSETHYFAPYDRRVELVRMDVRG